MKTIFVRATLGLLTPLAAIAAAHAQSVADFYKGKSVDLYIGYSVGGGYDLYARMLARYMGRHIPGHPTVVPKNMEGAGSLRLANWLYNVAPRDGTVMATYTYSVIFEPLHGNAAAKFDPRRFGWVGNMDESTQFCFVSRESGVEKFDDLLKKEVQFGGSGAGAAGPLSQTPLAIRYLTDAKIKLVQGIPSEKAKQIVAAIKDSKKKAQASIQGDTVRVASKDRDALQEVIALLRGKDFGVELQFTNYRS